MNALDEEPDPDAIKRKRRDEEIRREVEAHTVSEITFVVLAISAPLNVN